MRKCRNTLSFIRKKKEIKKKFSLFKLLNLNFSNFFCKKYKKLKEEIQVMNNLVIITKIIHLWNDWLLENGAIIIGNNI